MNIAINEKRLDQVADFLRGLDSCRPTDWTFPGLPAPNEPAVVDYFFTGVKHQYGFWLDDGTRYTEPMYAEVGGKRLKGSDFVWHSLRRSAASDPSIFDTKRQAEMSDAEVAAVFSDDQGRCPLPRLDTHGALWRAFARDLLAMEKTPVRIVAECRELLDPIPHLMKILSRLGGYKEDPLAKKAALLALILANRPERFLRAPAGTPFDIPPIVDYHNMRSCLRIGLLDVRDAALEKRLIDRRFVDAGVEAAIRGKVYDIVRELVRRSGKGIDSIDWFFFENRTRCPEMTEPDCPNCVLRDVCARRKDLFQPIFRTTCY